MGFKIFKIAAFIFAFAAFAQGQQALPQSKKQPPEEQSPAENVVYDTVYVDDGIPWNREYPAERMVRRPSFDPALKVGYTYSLGFYGSDFGTFAHQSFLAHVDYAFTPDLHLYANLGLWMPLYAHVHSGTPVAKEDVRQGRVGFVLPDVSLEYRPSENTYLRLMFINERDALKAYGPSSFYCNPYRYSIFCR